MLNQDTLARHMKRFIRDEKGATAIEYALIASFIFVVIVASVTAIGVNLTPIFQSAADGIASR